MPETPNSHMCRFKWKPKGEVSEDSLPQAGATLPPFNLPSVIKRCFLQEATCGSTFLGGGGTCLHIQRSPVRALIVILRHQAFLALLSSQLFTCIN
jgi:hypothetical protein